MGNGYWNSPTPTPTPSPSPSSSVGSGYGSPTPTPTPSPSPSSDNVTDSQEGFILLDAEVDGKILSLFFNSEIDNSIPSSSRFKILAKRKKLKIESITSSPSDGRIDILLKESVHSDDDIKLTYRDLKKDQITGVIQDADGADFSSVNSYEVENYTDELSLPTIVEAYLDGNIVRLEFDSLLNSTSLIKKRFKLKLGRKKVKVNGVDVDSEDASSVVISFQNMPQYDYDIGMTLSYRDLKGDQVGNVLEDIDGNDLRSFKNLNVDI